MDINKSSVRKILNLVLAGKEEERRNVAVRRRRYYFFNAPAENSIKFSALREILSKESPEKAAIIEKLQGGNSGRYYADYFRWLHVAVVTNEYTTGRGLVVYTCDLSNIGAKIAGSERVIPANSPVTAEKIEADNLLFEDKRGNSNVINIDKTGESYYLEEDPPGNLAKILVTGSVPPGHILNYDAFSRYYDEFRIWVPNLNQLLLPSFETPTSDDVEGGHYTGGELAYNKLIKPYEKKEEDKKGKKSLGEKMEEKKEIFEPVGQKPVAPEKGSYLDQGPGKSASERVSRNLGDYAEEPYSGGTDVLQRLIKEQRKHMKIRKKARKIVASYIKQGQMNDSKSVPISKDPQENIERSKLFQDIADKQKEIKQITEKVERERNI